MPESEYTVRFGEERDITALFTMGLEFLSESPYKDMEVIPEEVINTISQYINGDKKERILLVVVKNDIPVGMLAATTSKHLLNKDIIASEMLWWMDERERNSKGSFKLIEAFEYWARNVVKAKHIQLSNHISQSMDRVSRFYNKRGYRMVEQNFIKDIN
jgi:hypothetical protein